MSARFHDKWHRANHHTYKNTDAPDAGHDPIASPQHPFQGDFVIDGALTVSAPTSGTAAFITGQNGIDVTSSTGSAGIFRASVSDYGPFSNFQTVTEFSPKALTVYGYSDFQAPAYFHSVYANYFHISTFGFNTLSGNNVFIDGIINAENAFVNNLTALNITYVAVTATEMETTYTSLCADNIYTNDLSFNVRAAAGNRTTSITLPVSSWTLCPIEQVIYDPWNYWYSDGRFSPSEAGLYLCEMNLIARSVASSPLGIVAGISTDVASLSGSGIDNVPFSGGWFTNNGVSYLNAQNNNGVMFQGSTLIAVDGLTNKIGLYIFNSNSETIVDYARLRIVYQGRLVTF